MKLNLDKAEAVAKSLGCSVERRALPEGSGERLSVRVPGAYLENSEMLVFSEFLLVEPCLRVNTPCASALVARALAVAAVANAILAGAEES